MRYVNRLFTYLLTYLLDWRIVYGAIYEWRKRLQAYVNEKEHFEYLL